VLAAQDGLVELHLVHSVVHHPLQIVYLDNGKDLIYDISTHLS
jgi:hypothetical protein